MINQLNKNIPTEAIRTLLQQQTGITLSSAQIHKLQQKIRDIHNMMHGNSPAQQLITALNEDPAIQYVAYIVELLIGNELLTIRRTKKQLNSNRVVVDNTDVTSFNEIITIRYRRYHNHMLLQ